MSEEKIKPEESKESKFSIMYVVQGIGPYDRLKDWVQILLMPMDPLDVPKEQRRGNIMVRGIGPMGPVPPEAMDEMQAMFSQLLPQLRQRPEEGREIVLIEKDVDFQKRGWKYRDQINVTFEKLEMKD
jgi:hypothetical protein